MPNVSVFEEYLQDSSVLLQMGQKAAREGKEREARRFYRAAVFYTSGAMEAYVNYVADAFAKAGTLERHEACFINDKVLVFDEKKCLVVERIAFHSIEDKVKVLMRRFAPTYDFKSPTWCRFVECKGVRNQLVHPRNDEDDTDLATYDSHVTDGLSCTLQIMNALSGAIFQKPLRKQLLDLVP